MLFQRTNAPTWLLCFLGNPGAKYERTRHNAAWMACALLEQARKIKTDRLKFHAFTGVGAFGGETALFMRPQTYMNLSGDAVQPAAAFYKIPPERIIVMHDDIALPPGRLRIKRGGSDGGHKGVQSVAQRLGTPSFPRVKIGVGAPPHPDYDIIDWVISRVTDAELAVILEAAGRALDAAEELVAHGIDSAMNKYNQ